MNKLFSELKKCKSIRKNYRIKPCVRFAADRRRYVFSLIPTIRYTPWIYMYPNAIGVVDVSWLHFHIYFGKLELKGGADNA